VRIRAAVGEHDLDAGGRGIARRPGRALLLDPRELAARPREISLLEMRESIGIAHVVELAERKVHPDRIELRHGGEQGRTVLAHEVADADERQPRDPRDRDLMFV